MSDEPRYEPLDDMPRDEMPTDELSTDDLSADDPSRGDDVPVNRPLTPSKKPVRPPPGVSVGMPGAQPSATPRAAVPRSTRSVPNTDQRTGSSTAQSADQANQADPVEPPAPRRVQLTLPFTPALAERIKALRAKAGISGESPRDLPLTRVFTLPADAHLEDVVAAVSSTALPLTVTLTRVEAKVEERQNRQTYKAAWQIDSADQLGRIRAGLVGSLKEVLSADPPFEPLIVVGEDVPAKAFPALIAAMQREFEPLTWRIETISVRDEAPAPSP